MVQQEITIANSLGIHARPASMVVQTAGGFKSSVVIEKDGMKADAKSIMSVMMLAAAFESTVIVSATGPDEQEALDAMVKLFASKFNES